MRLSDPHILSALPALRVEWVRRFARGAHFARYRRHHRLLVIRRHDSLPELIALLRNAGIPFRFLGGGTNLLVRDGELPWVVLQLAQTGPEIALEGNCAPWTPQPTWAAPSHSAPSTIWAGWRD